MVYYQRFTMSAKSAFSPGKKAFKPFSPKKERNQRSKTPDFFESVTFKPRSSSAVDFETISSGSPTASSVVAVMNFRVVTSTEESEWVQRTNAVDPTSVKATLPTNAVECFDAVYDSLKRFGWDDALRTSPLTEFY